MKQIISRAREEINSGNVIGDLRVDGEIIENGEVVYGTYSIPFRLSESNELSFLTNVKFYSEVFTLEVDEEPKNIIENGLNWWVEYLEKEV